MKTIEQLYEEIQNDEALKQKFINSFKEGVIDDFLKDHECEATAEEVVNFMDSIRNGAISDDDLEQVAGGACTSYSCNCHAHC